jgi:hypothetical protein
MRNGWRYGGCLQLISKLSCFFGHEFLEFPAAGVSREDLERVTVPLCRAVYSLIDRFRYRYVNSTLDLTTWRHFSSTTDCEVH